MILASEELVAEAHANSMFEIFKEEYTIATNTETKPIWFIKEFIKSKSPIETLMAGILFRLIGYYEHGTDETGWEFDLHTCELVTPGGNTLKLTPKHYNTNHQIKIEREVKVGPYRVDFMITVDDVKKIGIECDGYAFHEKSQEQMIYEKERYRFLTSSGIEMLHFMGKEIRDSMITKEKDWIIGGCSIFWEVFPRIYKALYKD